MAKLNKYQKQAAAKYREGVVGDMGGQLQIEGLGDVQKAMRNFADDSRNDMKETHRKAGQIIVDGAARLVPVRTGALLASLKSVPTQRQGRVRVGSAAVPYAGPIHFGWPDRNIRPNPFIYEVLDGRRAEVLKLYEERINQLITKYDLGSDTRPKPRGGGSSGSSGSNTQPDVLLRDKSGNITGGIFGTKVVRF
jgi:hypothetical protein